jgi:hypothetical protein
LAIHLIQWQGMVESRHSGLQPQIIQLSGLSVGELPHLHRSIAPKENHMAKKPPVGSPPANSPAQAHAKTAENRPIQEFRHRRIRATVWKNNTTNGTMYTVTITRAFKQGEEWRDSHNFGYDDVLIVAKLMYDAHSFISMERAREATASKASRPPTPAKRPVGASTGEDIPY